MATPDWAQKLLAARATQTQEIQNVRQDVRPPINSPVSNSDSDDSILALTPSVNQSGSSAPSQYEIIHERILSLSAALLADHPAIPTLLQEIRRTIKNDPALVTLLQPSDIRIIVNGLEKQTGVYLAASLTSPKAAAKAKLKNVSTSDLGF